MKKYNIAVIGATGNAGRTTLQILADRDFPINKVVAIASQNSVGKFVSCGDHTLKVQDFASVDFSDIDIAIFCAGNAVSAKYVPQITKAGCTVIDKSSFFRMDSQVPLIVPEVNGDLLKKGAPLGIIATPNCVATPLSLSLSALPAVPKHVVVSTYQSVSGAGKKGIDELYEQTKSTLTAMNFKREVFAKPIAFNVIPEIGSLNEAGISDEEEKVSNEVAKILNAPIKVAVTCVRVPVFIGHAMSVACEFKKSVDLAEVYEGFDDSDGIVLLDRRDRDGGFATPLEIQGEDGVYVSRIRKDNTVPNVILYWVVADNLRKGAALNSVQIAETIIEMDPTLRKFKR